MTIIRSRNRRITTGQYVSYFGGRSVGRIVDVSGKDIFKIRPARVRQRHIFLCAKDIQVLHPVTGRARYGAGIMASAVEYLHNKLRFALMAWSIIRLSKATFLLACYVLSVLTADHFSQMSTVF